MHKFLISSILVLYMIEVKNLKMVFEVNKRKIPVINNLSFYLPEKGMYFIEGKSGSGKSTLLNLIEGLYKPTKGYIKINNKRIDSLTDEEKTLFYKNEIGILFQSFNLFNDLTLKENLSIASLIKEDIDENIVKRYLAKFRLSDKLDQKVYSLSGGEKQRLGLIRALINNPKIILADEPTGALDNDSSIVLMEELKKISENSLVLVVTHNEELVNKYADGSIIFLEEGYLLNNVLKDNPNENLNIIKNKKKVKEIIKFYFPLLLRNLFKNIKRNVFMGLSVIFSLLITIFSFSFYININNTSKNLIYSYPNYNIYEVYRSFKTSINDSSLAIEKKEKIDNMELMTFLKENDFNNYIIKDNFDYFFKNNVINIDGNTYENIVFEPSFELMDNEIIVNEAFISSYIKEYKEGITINFKSENEYSAYSKVINDEIKETFNFDINFLIKEVSKEFNFLSTPKIYYSYSFFENYLSLTLASNFSSLENNKTTYLDLLRKAENNDPLTSYSSYLFIEKDDFSRFNLFIDNEENIDDYRFYNDSRTIISSFKDIINTLFIALIIFIIIISLTSIFIIFSLTFYSYLSSKKERAILFLLGSNKKSIDLIYVLEPLIIYLISFIGGIILFNLIKNPILNKINSLLTLNLTINPSIFFFLIIFIIYFLIILFSALIPLLVSKNIDIASELKEE